MNSSQSLEAELQRLRLELDRRAKSKQEIEVDVTFLAANADQDIAHTLQVENPENIRYVVVRKDRACDVYDNQTAPRRSWTKDYIVLRSSTAGAVVTLRLSAI